MVNKQHITVLLQQFADGDISKADYAELISYFNLTGNEEEIFAAMDAIWKTTGADELYTDEEADHFYEKLIRSKEFKSNRSGRSLKLWYRYVAAAVILIAVSAGLYYYSNTYLAPASVRFAKQDIDPGSNRAILTLANGKKVELAASGTYTVDDVKAAEGALNNGDDVAFNTITTPRGGQYQINLPDGSSVWLNASTSLTFPVKFSKQERSVSLVGEAYFEIAKVYSSLKGHKQERMPFLVNTKEQTVEVLGTHFNIKGYADESTVKTTLLEGSVRISLSTVQLPAVPKYTPSAILSPGQQATLSGNAIKVSVADTEEALAWKNGLFMFDGQDLESIMKQVARWYDVDVVFENEELKKQAFKGTISRFKKISQLLEVLESTGSVHFKMEGRRITAMK